MPLSDDTVGSGRVSDPTPIQMRAAGYQGPKSILTRSLRHFVDGIGLVTDLTPDCTAEGQTARDMFNGLEIGERDVGYLASGYLTARVPSLGLLDLPFAVTDRAMAHAAWDGPVGERLAQDIYEVTGLRVLGFWDNGFRHVTTGTKQIRTPEHCLGLSVRTLDNQIYQDTLRAIGFTPVVTDVAGLKAAVASGDVDAQENPLTNLLSFGLDEWHKSVSLTGHIHGCVLHVANGEWWDGLSEAEKNRVTKAARDSAALQRHLAAEADATAMTVLSEKGIRPNLPEDLDLDAFRRAVQPVFQRVLSTCPEVLARDYLREINYYR